MGKKVLLAAILIFILVSVPLTIFLVNQRQELRMKAAVSTNLFFEPQSRSIEVGETLNINVSIDTQTNQIISTVLSLDYDPEILEFVSINPGSFLPNPIELRKISSGRKINFSFYTQTPQQGSGILATLQFTAKAPGVVQLQFDENTSIRTSQDTDDTGINKVDGVYTVVSGAVIPQTNLPSPSATSLGLNTIPTLSPSPTPSGNLPSISPSPSPSLSPTPTLAIGGSDSITYSPTATPTIQPTTLPASGILENTILVSLGGILILGIGLFFLLA